MGCREMSRQCSVCVAETEGLRLKLPWTLRPRGDLEKGPGKIHEDLRLSLLLSLLNVKLLISGMCLLPRQLSLWLSFPDVSSSPLLDGILL